VEPSALKRGRTGKVPLVISSDERGKAF
jgi:hypothetical protein